MRFLYETVKEILETGRVGVPVFLRCSAQIEAGDDYVEEVLMRILAMACSWMDAVPLRLYAQNGNKSNHLTVTAHYVGGQTAIVSVNAAPGIKDSLDLMLLGNKGALYHDSESLPPGFDITTEPLKVPEWLVDAVIESYRSGEPTLIEEVMGFG